MGQYISERGGLPVKIIKRSGEEAVFDREKILAAITKANQEVTEDKRLTEEQI